MSEQLKLNFEESQKKLDQAMLNFADASKKYAASLDQGNPETKELIDEEAERMRASVRRLVGVLASQTGLDFHTCWVLAYHEHEKRTGFHAVAVSKGEGTHLSKIAEAGHMPQFRDTVVGMLTSYPPRK